MHDVLVIIYNETPILKETFIGLFILFLNPPWLNVQNLLAILSQNYCTTLSLWFGSRQDHNITGHMLELSGFGSVNRSDKEAKQVWQGGWGASFAVYVSSGGCRHRPCNWLQSTIIGAQIATTWRTCRRGEKTKASTPTNMRVVSSLRPRRGWCDKKSWLAQSRRPRDRARADTDMCSHISTGTTRRDTQLALWQ
jgi:hypothetical protein